MRITEGNLFAGMRLVLPEHRAAVTRWQADVRRQPPPALAEDVWQEMAYTWAAAEAQQRSLRVRLYTPEGEEVWEGLPESRGGELWLRTAEGRRRLDRGRVTGMEAGAVSIARTREFPVP
ncbi:MAG: YolD-like family protein [Alicyclobacillus sp.]|nr:YolD-like family protein [Alicyclobacillus sp.]